MLATEEGGGRLKNAVLFAFGDKGVGGAWQMLKLADEGRRGGLAQCDITVKCFNREKYQYLTSYFFFFFNKILYFFSSFFFFFIQGRGCKTYADMAREGGFGKCWHWLTIHFTYDPLQTHLF